jgi:putative transposase
MPPGRHRLCAATVSDLNKKICRAIEGRRNRSDGLAPVRDFGRHRAQAPKRSWAGEARNVSLLEAIGVNSQGFQEILRICEEAKEDKGAGVHS